ncbi:MAG: aminotransferase class I/II-fold pyridoxal phosphate-dependent enzyme, partial [Bdellovibrionales bacterium]|nr:aminotransferase class I/II-fold pyridoxal phosphate-dependent enzyme [Bdellovibrionales bacterium]
VRPNEVTGALVEPISQCAVYAQSAPGEFKYDYGRSMNPNFYSLEEALAPLENAKYATVVSSGVGAMSAVITLVKAGDTVLLPTDIYGGTYRLYYNVFGHYGINFKQVNMTDLDLVEAELKQGVKMLYTESPTNPLLQIYDLKALSALAKKYGALTVTDNTFASPVCQNPLDLGIDVVLHSASKYLGGHSDIIGGALMTNDPKIHEQMDFARKSIGLHLDPFSMFLLRRGIKTLPLRVNRQQESAMIFAKHLESHPKIDRVYYPGLESHPQHALAKEQMKGFGGMVSAEFALPTEAVLKLVTLFEVMTLAESLGAVETLVQIPASMSNQKIPKEVREKHGLRDGLVRFSIGIEDCQDLLDDLDQALDQVG